MARPLQASNPTRRKITPVVIQKTVDGVDAGERSGMLGNLLAFCRVLRDLELDVTAGRILDICRSLEYIDICNQAQFYYTLRSNLVSSQEDIKVFDQVFALFWKLPEEEQESQSTGKKESDEEGDECCDDMPPKQVFVEDFSDNGSKEDEEETTMTAYSPDEVIFTK
ncbi:MAG: hypothetical protein Q8P59_11760, partial [Dehalococcoidia bacterium]|nr:hypothetical protein [Dehalococcoidia bacterium]